MKIRYTPGQLLDMAKQIVHDLEGDSFYADELRQAADDAERLAAAEADAERYRTLKELFTDNEVGDGGKFNLPDFGVVHFEWKRRTWVNGKPVVVLELDKAIDAARNPTKEG